MEISIHVTAKVTTDFDRNVHYISKISIHVTAKVTTAWPVQAYTRCCDFNPRHREGDDSFLPALPRRVGISIHVTAKVTT